MSDDQFDDAPSPARPSRWRPDPLTWVVLAMVVWNAVILWLAFHGTLEHDVGNDAAGKGIARAFREVFAMGAGAGIALLVVPYMLIRRRGVRIALVMLLLFASLSTPLLLG